MAMSSLEPYGQLRATSSRGDQKYREDDERWHVRITDDDVKMMTLEQLDDAYRLSIVDSETALWKPGMREWQPLRVVAGLEPDEDDAVEVEVDDEPEITRVGPTPYDLTPRAPAVPLLRTLPAPNPPPRRSSAPPPPVTRSAPPPTARSAPPAPRLVSMLPPAPVTRSPEPVFVPQSRVTSIPPPQVAAARAPVRHVAPQPRTDMLWNQPPSSPPVALSVAPAYYPQPQSGGFGRLLLGVAFLAGTAVSLYRNDILLDWARAGHLENQFLGAEQRLLGGPAFGTLRAVATSAPLWEPPSNVAAVASVATAAPVATVAAEPVAPALLPENEPLTKPIAATPPPSAVAVVPPAAPESKHPADPPVREAAVTPRPSAPSSTPRPTPSRATTSMASNTQATRSAAKASASGPAAVRVRLDEEPEAKPEPSKAKPAPVSLAPASPAASPASQGSKAGLDDAIRNAMSHKSAPRAPKKKSGASEYDPLNPDL